MVRTKIVCAHGGSTAEWPGPERRQNHRELAADRKRGRPDESYAKRPPSSVKWAKTSSR
jgi:hypothetical protein